MLRMPDITIPLGNRRRVTAMRFIPMGWMTHGYFDRDRWATIGPITFHYWHSTACQRCGQEWIEDSAPVKTCPRCEAPGENLIDRVMGFDDDLRGVG